MLHTDEEYRERQENEVLAIASMYPDECRDLRREDVWSVPRPPELAIRLQPAPHEQKGSGDEQVNCAVTLHLKMPARYPDSPPKVALNQAEGLSEDELTSLRAELEKLARQRVGEEMVLDLVEAGCACLLSLNRPRFQSLHAEKEHHERQRRREEDARQKQQQEQQLAEQQRRRLEVQQAQQRRRQQLHEQRAALRQSLSRDDTPPVHSSRGDSESQEECAEHAGTCRLSVPGRDEVLCGQCVEHRSSSVTVRVGLDLRSGVPLRLLQWTVRWRPTRPKLKQSSRSKTSDIGESPARERKAVKEQLSALQRELSSLQKLRHDNLVSYQGMSVQESEESATVFVLQDLVQGTDLTRHLRQKVRMDIRQLRFIAGGLTAALAYLHSRHVIHRDLRHSSVLVDAVGRVRLADFSLCRRMLDLCDSPPASSQSDFPPYSGRSGKKADVYRLGLLLVSLARGCLLTESVPAVPDWLPEPARHFLSCCLDEDEQRRWSASQLSEHGFLTSDTEVMSVDPVAAPEPAPVPEPPPSEINTVAPGPRQRLSSDFIVLEHLGSGGFGEVLKVRNKVDGKLYAVKKILLEQNRQQDQRKIAVEAQHLSILQHENIVRYYTSWMEADVPEGNSDDDDDGDAEGNESSDSGTEDETLDASATSDGDDSSSSILFEAASDVRGGGDVDGVSVVPYTTPSGEVRRHRRPRVRLYLCIQMEYCEKSTLRTALGRLCCNQQLLWQLFREIIEGLAHIHQHGLIHRDLKPDNIFLDQHEHVKIGDFGLATSKVVKPRVEEASALERSQAEAAGDVSDASYAYAVGTALYRAPELQPGAVGRRGYTNKVDIYSLGVIWYEMCCGLFATASERIHRLTQVRQPQVAIPEEVRQRLTDQQLQLLAWLLNHAPIERPSCVQLLSSDLVPSPPLEEARVRTLFRDTVRRPDTKRYMHLVSACMSQKASLVEDCAYDVTLSRPAVAPDRAVLSEVARCRLVRLFRRHGAVPLSAPLLALPTDQFGGEESVRMMTGTGALVELPRSQRLPLARLLARAGSGPLRHYTIERVYQERLPRGVHPRERQEALFGALAPPAAALLADAELLAVLSELVAEFPALTARDYQLVLGHTLLLEAALEAAAVSTERRRAVLDVLAKLGKDTARPQLQRELESLGVSEKAVSQLLSRLEARGTLERVQVLFGSRRQSEAAKQALHELATVTEYAERLGVGFPVVIHAGLVLGQQQRLYGGVVFQLVCSRRRGGQDVLAVGGRYDPVLAHYWDLLGPAGVPPPAATAVSVSFDKCVSAVAEEGRTSAHAPFDVVVLDGGDRTVTRRQGALVRRLWAAGVQAFLYAGADTAAAADEAARWAAAQGARALVLPKDTDAKVVRVRPLETRAALERSVPADDLLACLASLGVMGAVQRPSDHSSPPPAATPRPEPSTAGLPVRWVVHRDTARPKDRQLLEAAAERQLAPELAALGGGARPEVLLVELDQEDLQQLTRLKLNELESSFQQSVDQVLDQCRGQRKYVAKVCDELARVRVRRCVVVLFNYQTSSRLLLACAGADHWR